MIRFVFGIITLLLASAMLDNPELNLAYILAFAIVGVVSVIFGTLKLKKDGVFDD